jgi:predicted lipoprotein with Yx(FWY)xxD motif
MQTSQGTHPTPRTSRARATAIAALCALFAAAAAHFPAEAAAAAGTKRVVGETSSPTLGRTVLTNRRGLTLYSLSVERHGRFVCKGSCLSLWHPLLVRKGVKPTGPVRLGTVRRPEGRTQVTFRGRPLYSFSGDSKKGEANGEGFRDVGTWHAASPRQSQPSAPPPPSPYPYPESPGTTYPEPSSPTYPETPPPYESPYAAY